MMPFGTNGVSSCNSFINSIVLHEETDALGFAGNTNCQNIILSGATGGNYDPVFGVYSFSTMNFYWAKTIHYYVWLGGMTISTDGRLLITHYL